jgi:hypothetical protein
MKEERRRRWKREIIIRRREWGKVVVGGEVNRHDVCVWVLREGGKYCLV